jgi:hypothetical protein
MLPHFQGSRRPTMERVVSAPPPFSLSYDPTASHPFIVASCKIHLGFTVDSLPFGLKEPSMYRNLRQRQLSNGLLRGFGRGSFRPVSSPALNVRLASSSLTPLENQVSIFSMPRNLSSTSMRVGRSPSMRVSDRGQRG